MLRLVKSVEERPEHSTVINWTVPVYIKNGEDYYKVCFDIKRKPLPDGTLELTKEEIKTVEEMTGICFIAKVVYTIGKLRAVILADSQTVVNILNVKAILWLAERFELSSNN